MTESTTGPSRGSLGGGYFLLTPDNIVDNALPDFIDTVVHPMATPRSNGARFGQYLLEFGSGGRSRTDVGRGFESFLYQMAGEVVVHLAGEAHKLNAQSFCYLPDDLDFAIESVGSASATFWTKRRYEEVSGVSRPEPVFGSVPELAAVPDDVPGVSYKELLPADDCAFDMAMNVLIFEPGSSIGQVEMHHQEHGLLLLSGQGLYYLAGDYHRVYAGDYIYMAPYCPQSFYATGGEPASYLLYKDVNRDGF